MPPVSSSFPNRLQSLNFECVLPSKYKQFKGVWSLDKPYVLQFQQTNVFELTLGRWANAPMMINDAVFFKFPCWWPFACMNVGRRF